MISLGSVRAGAKVIAQNSSTLGATGVNLLLSDPTDYNLAIAQALLRFGTDRPNRRVVDLTMSAEGFRITLAGAGAAAELTGDDAWSSDSDLLSAWLRWDDDDQDRDPVDPKYYRITDGPGGRTYLEFRRDRFAAADVVRLLFSRPHALTEAPNTVAAPSAAPTVTIDGAAGNINAGTHSYVYTFVSAHGETTPSPASSAASFGSNGKAVIGIGVSSDYGVTARRVYRTVAGDTGDRKLVGTVANNTATHFDDDVADGSLGAAAPAANTAGGANTVSDDDETRMQTLAAAFILQLAANKAVQNTGNTGLPNDVVDRRSQSAEFAARSKALFALYGTMIGDQPAGDVSAASAFGDVDSEFSDGRGYVWNRRGAGELWR